MHICTEYTPHIMYHTSLVIAFSPLYLIGQHCMLAAPLDGRAGTEHGCPGSAEFPRFSAIITGPNPEPVSTVFPAHSPGEKLCHFHNVSKSKIVTGIEQILSGKAAIVIGASLTLLP